METAFIVLLCCVCITCMICATFWLCKMKIDDYETSYCDCETDFEIGDIITTDYGNPFGPESCYLVIDKRHGIGGYYYKIIMCDEYGTMDPHCYPNTVSWKVSCKYRKIGTRNSDSNEDSK